MSTLTPEQIEKLLRPDMVAIEAEVKRLRAEQLERDREQEAVPRGKLCPHHHRSEWHDWPIEESYCPDCRTFNERLRPVVMDGIRERVWRERFAAYTEIVERVAEDEPVEESDYGGLTYRCHYCRAWVDGPKKEEDVVHEPDCTWVTARKLRGKE